jgi:short-subunit dehydrogenase
MIPPTWLITGASRGIGFHIAKAALDAGSNVVVTARHGEALRDSFASHGDQCLSIQHDASQTSASAAIIQQARDVFNEVDVLVLNAGQGMLASLEETDEARERALFDLLYHGPVSMIRAMLPHMRARGQGHIVVIGAAATHGNYAGFSTYGAAKAALECACEALQAEVKPLGIRVSIAIPGPFRTDFITKAETAKSDVYAASVGRFATVLERMNGRQPGDPSRLGALIVDQVHSGTLPFRFPLGAYALKKLRDRGAQFQREADAFAEAAVSADFQA